MKNIRQDEIAVAVVTGYYYSVCSWYSLGAHRIYTVSLEDGELQKGGDAYTACLLELRRNSYIRPLFTRGSMWQSRRAPTAGDDDKEQLLGNGWEGGVGIEFQAGGERHPHDCLVDIRTRLRNQQTCTFR